MRITTNRELRNNFLAGLQIVGENSEGELEWMGSDKEWQEANQLNKNNGE